MSVNHRTERACPDCGTLVMMTPQQKRCAACQKRHKLDLEKARYRQGHAKDAMHEIVCVECGARFLGAGVRKYCPDCSTPEAAAARKRARAAVKKPRELKCQDCGAVFMGLPKKKYCPECSTPEAKRERTRGKYVAKIIEDMRDGESAQARKARKKHEKLIADLISGARAPKTNHEAIAKMEALGRIHGGAFGGYGKEVAGYYEQKE